MNFESQILGQEGQFENVEIGLLGRHQAINAAVGAGHGLATPCNKAGRFRSAAVRGSGKRSLSRAGGNPRLGGRP